jgi:hypothetical protein
MKTEHKVIVSVALITIIILVGGIWFVSKNEIKNKENLSKSMMGEKIDEMNSIHVTRGETHELYNSNPPTSGPHYGDSVAGPGIKNEQLPDELVLHSMEHGAVVLWYRHDLPESDVDKLKSVFSSASGKKIMLPRENLDTPIALASWNYLLNLEVIDEAKIKEFIETNNDRAPEKAPI